MYQWFRLIVFFMLISLATRVNAQQQSLAFDFTKDSTIDASQRSPSGGYSPSSTTNLMREGVLLFINGKQYPVAASASFAKNDKEIRSMKVVQEKEAIASYTSNETINKVVLVKAKKKFVRRVLQKKFTPIAD